MTKAALLNSTRPVRFRGGGGAIGDKPVRIPDTVKSTDTIEGIIGLGEGPWNGLVNGPRSFFTDDTPVSNVDGRSNIGNFELEFFPGGPLGEVIKPRLGGFASSRTVGVRLAQNTSVVRAGQQTQIDYLELRFVVQQLLNAEDNGSFPADLEWRIEYKRSDSATWLPAYDIEEIPPLDPTLPPDGNAKLWSVGADEFIIEGDPLNDLALWQANTPSTNFGLAGGVWFESDNDNKPKFYVSGAWSLAPDLVTTGSTHTYTNPHTSVAEKVTYVGQNQPAPEWEANHYVLFYNVATPVKNQFNTSYGATHGEILVPLPGVIKVKEKITSTTAKEVRFPVANINVPYDLRVTKLTEDAGSKRVEHFSWESFQEVKAVNMAFPNTSCYRFLTKASDQFSRVPTLQGEWECRIVNVPSNYDPKTRVYTGVWDGTYKKGYTNNPFFCLQDFIENDSFGMSRIYPQTVNKFAFYAAAQWADENIQGRPRWTFNEVVYEPKNAKEFANYMAGAAGARIIDDGNGFIDLLVDRDTPAVALFGLHNVHPDGFRYSYTDPQTRANDVLIRFRNPDLFWARDARRVTDEADIALNGRRTSEIYAVGCIDGDEATSRGLYRLRTGLDEKEMVSFRTQRKGFYLRPYEIILVADPFMGYGITRRLKTKAGPNSVTLRDSVALEEGIEYWATFDIVNPAYPETSAQRFLTVRNRIMSPAGTHFSLTFLDDLPASLADEAMFTIEALADFGTPKPFRILNIEAPEGDPDHVEVTALEVNRNKWPIIEGTVPPDTGPIIYSRVQGGPVLPVKNLAMRTEVREYATTSVRVAVLSWELEDTTTWAKRYRILHSINGSTPAEIGIVDEPNYEFTNLGPGRHVFTVIAVDAFNPTRQSAPRSITIDVEGVSRYVPPPASLVLVNGVGAKWNNLDAQFAWEHSAPNPEFSHFEVTVLDANNVPLRVENVGATKEYFYTWDAQQEEGLRRAFTLNVRAIDQFANPSAPAVLAVTNPVPAKPTNVRIEGALGGANIIADPCNDGDFAGMYVWVSSTAGFNPLTLTPTYIATGNSFFIPRNNAFTFYARVAFYDKYGNTVSTLNISDQVQGAARTILPAEVPELTVSKITGLQTTINQINANYTTLTGQVADAQQAIADLEDQIGVEVQSALTGINSQITTINNNLATTNSNVTAVQNSVNNTNTVVAGHTSSISSLQTAITNETGARTTAINNLTTTVNGNTSAITALQTTVANNQNALSQQITALTASVNGHTSQISAANTAIANESSARTTAVNSLNSTVGTHTSQITAIQNTIATLDGVTSERLDTLEATVGSNTSAITAAQSAITNEVSARTTAVNSLTTTVNGHTSQIATINSTLSTETSTRTAAINALNSSVNGQKSAIEGLQSTQVDLNGLRYAEATVALTASAQELIITNRIKRLVPCAPGDRIEASALVAGTVGKVLKVYISWLNAAGTQLSVVQVGSNVTSDRVGGGVPETYHPIGGFAVAPANAAFAAIVCGITSTAAGSHLLRVARPFVAKALATGNTLTPWNPGFFSGQDALVAAIGVGENGVVDDEFRAWSTYWQAVSPAGGGTQVQNGSITAIAARVDSLTSTVNTHTSQISSAQTAIADEVSARTSAISSLTTTVNGHTSSISSLTTAISNETSARTSAINSLNSTVGTHTSQISSLSTTIANETSARTSAINTLTSTVNGMSASITANAAAVSDITGRVEGTAGLVVQAGTHIAGMRLHAVDGTEVAYSSVDFLSTVFRIFNDAGGATAPFFVQGNQVFIQEACIQTLSANKITAGTITAGLGVGNANVFIDGPNARILISD